MPNALAALQPLLVELFDVRGLRRFLLLNYPDIATVIPEGDSSRQDSAMAAVEELRRRGLVDAGLFTRLVEAAPGQSERIAEVCARCGIDLVPARARDTPRPSPELDRAWEAVGKKRAEQKRLLLAGESAVHLNAELERLEVEVKRLQFIAAIGAMRRPPLSGQPFTPGFILADRYELVEVVGRGGFARVWKAFDLHEHQAVAVKVLREDLTDERERVERFLRGAREMAKLDHPGIVKVVGTPGEVEGRPWFAMEFLHGGNLAEAFQSKKLTWKTALPCLLQVGSALQCAHDHGLLHRDVKPENILLNQENYAKLTDFDLVRLEDSTVRSKSHERIGTFLYSAPETFQGHMEFDVRVDVYSLGMTMLFSYCEGEIDVSKCIFERDIFFHQLVCDESLKTIFKHAVARHAHARLNSVQILCEKIQAITQNTGLSTTRLFHQRVGPFKLSMLKLQPGNFLMGTPKKEIDFVLSRARARTREKWREWLGWQTPQHEVILTYEFFLSQTPITQGLYTFIMKQNPSFFKRSTHPVEQVTWLDAIKFCNRLSEFQNLPQAYSIQEEHVDWSKNSSGYRLPTEAEWEYACRGGTATVWHHGNDANQLGEYACFQMSTTCEVGIKKPNSWGLLDMHGNVWEWCWDWFDKDYYASSPTTNPLGPLLGTEHTARGGSFRDAPEDLRSADRGRGHNPGRSLGFRVALGAIDS